MTIFARRSVIGLLILTLAAFSSATLAAEKASWITEKRLALAGHDPVSYFIEGRPVKGSIEYTASYDDAIYWFKSPEHRAMFVADPDHYAPQFRGWCTNTMSKGDGDKHEADPENWVIAEGKLYVFGSQRGVVRYRGGEGQVMFEAAAQNWKKLRADH
jgi:YHS domain-containing protein